MSSNVFETHDALGLAELVRTGETSPKELLDEAIARAETADAEFNILAGRNFDTSGRRSNGVFRKGHSLVFRSSERTRARRSRVSSERRVLALFADNRSPHTSTLAQRSRRTPNRDYARWPLRRRVDAVQNVSEARAGPTAVDRSTLLIGSQVRFGLYMGQWSY